MCLAEDVSGVSVMQEDACFSLVSVSFEKMHSYAQNGICISQKALLGDAVLSFQLSSAGEVGVQSKGKAAAREQQGLLQKGRRNNIKPLCQPHCKTLPESKKIFLLCFLSVDTKLPGDWHEKGGCTDTI